MTFQPDLVRSHRWALQIPGFHEGHMVYAKTVKLPTFDGETGGWTEMCIQFYQDKATLTFMVNNVSNLLFNRDVEIKVVLGSRGEEETAWRIVCRLCEFVPDDLDYEHDRVSTMLLRFKTKRVIAQGRLHIHDQALYSSDVRQALRGILPPAGLAVESD